MVASPFLSSPGCLFVMPAPPHTTPLSALDKSPIEDLRVITILMVVLYHVIGLPDSGLRMVAPHPLRALADLLNIFMMPAFAMIAGLVYAVRPPTLRGFASFMGRKLQRLAIPGLVASLIFAAIATVMHLRWAVEPASLWRLAVYPYAHFWFLQSLLTIFLLVGFADAATGHRAALPLLAVSILLANMDIVLPGFFSLHSTIGLLPYFIIGICLRRHARWIEARSGLILPIALACALLWCLVTAIDYARTGLVDQPYRQWWPMIFVVSLFLLLLFRLPHHRGLAPFGPMTFTIYLYHVLGTAGARILLHKLGVESLPVHLLAGVAGGVLLPVALHLLVSRWPLGARFMLGLRPRGAASRRALVPSNS